jgi:hypothetical protein
MLLQAWKEPVMSPTNMWCVCKCNSSSVQFWTGDVSLTDVPLLLFLDALIILTFIASSILLPILTFTWTPYMTMKCNHLSATVVFAVVLMTLNKHFRYDCFFYSNWSHSDISLFSTLHPFGGPQRARVWPGSEQLPLLHTAVCTCLMGSR